MLSSFPCPICPYFTMFSLFYLYSPLSSFFPELLCLPSAHGYHREIHLHNTSLIQAYLNKCVCGCVRARLCANIFMCLWGFVLEVVLGINEFHKWTNRDKRGATGRDTGRGGEVESKHLRCRVGQCPANCGESLMSVFSGFTL